MRFFFHNEKLGFSGSLRGIYRGRYGYRDRNLNTILDAPEEYAPGYDLWHISISQHIRKVATVQLGIDNIFDEKRLDYTPSLPRANTLCGIDKKFLITSNFREDTVMKTLNLLLFCIFVFATVPALAQTPSNADFDGSGKVDFPDFLLFAQAFGSTTEAVYDLDNSGTVDFADFLLFVQVFGSEPEPPPSTEITTLTEVNARDIPADPNRQDVFTYYSLRDSAIVSPADSNSTKWDLAFKSTTVLTNSGISGPGQGGAIALTATDYDTLSTAPESGYVQDQAGLPAIGRAWYTYTGPEGFPPHAILMNPGVVLVIRTADGRYAKLKFTSYYKGGGAIPSADSQSRFYNFTYTFQPDGTRSLR